MTHPSDVVALQTWNIRSAECANFVVVSVDGPAPLADRLQAMGFCPGGKVRLIRHGDPAVVELLGTRVGLAGAILRHIHVTPLVAGAAAPAPPSSRSVQPPARSTQVTARAS